MRAVYVVLCTIWNIPSQEEEEGVVVYRNMSYHQYYAKTQLWEKIVFFVLLLRVETT